MSSPYNVKTKARTIPDFSFKDNVGANHTVYWQLEEGRVYFRAVDIWQAVTRGTGHFSKSHLRLTDTEAKRLKEFKFPDSPTRRAVCSLSLSLALTVCERLSPTDVPTEVEKWIRDQVAPGVGEVVPSSAAAMLARAKSKKKPQIVKSQPAPAGKIKKTSAPISTAPFTPEDVNDLFAGASVPPTPSPAPQPKAPPILTTNASAAELEKSAAFTAMLRADLDIETLAYDLLFMDASAGENEFHGQGYALPAVSPVPGQVLWPERLGIACDALDKLFSLTAEEAAKLEPCLWMHKSPDGSQRRVIDSTGWAKMLAFSSVAALPDQHKAVTALFSGAAIAFTARQPEADPGCITVISESAPTPAPVPPPAPATYPANAPQPDIASPAQPSIQSAPVLPARKLSYWSQASRSVPVRVGQDGLGQLWVARVDLEKIVGEEMAWPYDAREVPAGRIMHDSKVYSSICETAIPLIVAAASNGVKTEALKFAQWWAHTVQASFGQTKPVNQVWPVPGERVVSPTMQAKAFSYVYNGRLVATIWVGEDAVGGLWIARRDLEHIFGSLHSWPMAARQAARGVIENEYGKYPAISEDIIDDLVKAGKIATSREMALDFSLWFAQDVAPKFGPNAPAVVPQPPSPKPSKSSPPPLEGELMDFHHKGIKYEMIVAVDDDDDIWADIASLVKVLGAEARDWPQATQKALVRGIAFKGAVKPAIQEKWLEVIADISPFRPRAEAFTTWWLSEVMPYFDTTEPTPAPRPQAPSSQAAAPAAKAEAEDAEFVEVLDPKPATYFLPITLQEAPTPMSKQARELANLLMSMADALDTKDRENAELRSQLAERNEDRKKLQAIQAALGLK
jgi:hypothetical protein